MGIDMNHIEHIEIMSFFRRIFKLSLVGNDYAKTPKSPEGDFKAAPLGEVWRGKTKAWLQFVSPINKNLTFETASYSNLATSWLKIVMTRFAEILKKTINR